MTNLLGNALRATPPGEPGRPGRAEGDFAVLEVTDSGEGIAPGELERIFERFYRCPDAAATTTTRVGDRAHHRPGIARAHGGDLEAASPDGGGLHVHPSGSAVDHPGVRRLLDAGSVRHEILVDPVG